MVLRDEELPEALGDFISEAALGLAIILEWKAGKEGSPCPEMSLS